MATNYTNFLIEVANECNFIKNDILGEDAMPETIKYIREYTNNRYLIGSSVVLSVPSDDLIEAADMILLHGNSQSPQNISNMINQVRNTNAYKKNPKPIVFNEDDHYDFNSSINNFASAVNGHAGWGVFVDCNKTSAGDYKHGYQCV